MRSVVLVLLLLAPMAAAEGSPVTLYAHLAGYQDMPLNTQVPEVGDDYEPAAAVLTPPSNCVHAPAGTTTITEQQHHTWYAYGSSSTVDYNISDDGRPRIHLTRGLSDDLRLIGDSTFHWYLSGSDQPGLDNYVPEVQLRVTVRLGDDVSVGHQAFNNGELVARAQTAPVLLQPGIDTGEVTHHSVNGRDVYGFHVDLEHQLDTIPAREGYNVRVDFFQTSPHCSDDEYAMAADLWPWQGAGLWNRWEMVAQDPVYVEYLHPQIIRDDVVVHLSAGSVFGNYDLGTGGTIHLLDDQGNEVTDLVELLDYRTTCNCHDHGRENARQTWAIDATELSPGLYTGTVTVKNLQGTANATAKFAFELGETVTLCGTAEGAYGCQPMTLAQESPAPALPLLGLALLALALRRR